MGTGAASERKFPQTVKAYRDGVHRFLTWAKEHDRSPDLDRPTVAEFVADLLDAGAEASTARSRHLAVRRFCRWLEEEGEIERDQLVGSPRPSSTRRCTSRSRMRRCGPAPRVA